MKNSEVYQAYLDAFTSGDIDTAQTYIADDFVFEGPILKATGKEAFFNGISPDLIAMTKGYNMLRQFEEGDEVCSIYEYIIETPAGENAIFMIEWNRVRNNQLTSARLLFDPAPFTVPASG